MYSTVSATNECLGRGDMNNRKEKFWKLGDSSLLLHTLVSVVTAEVL